MDDVEAVRRSLAGDRDAFGALVQLQQAGVIALCLRLTGNRPDALDMAQQAFIKAYQHLFGFDPHLPFTPWLHRIATNECIALLRRRKRQAIPVTESTLEGLSGPDDAPALADLTADRERVREAVARLPDPYRAVVLMYYFQERSYQEIGRETGLAPGTVATHLHRAKQQLRRLLSAEEGTAHAPSQRQRPTEVPGRSI